MYEPIRARPDVSVVGIVKTFNSSDHALFRSAGWGTRTFFRQQFLRLVTSVVRASSLRGADLRRYIGPTRMILILFIVTGIAICVAVADGFIYLVYDGRYYAAGFFLTALMVGIRFPTLGTMSDAMMMGTGKPSDVAFGNGAKLAAIVALLTDLLVNYGINVAIAVFVLAELVRYVVLMSRKMSQGVGFAWQDVIPTVIFILLALLIRKLTILIGLTGGMSDWIIQAQTAHV